MKRHECGSRPELSAGVETSPLAGHAVATEPLNSGYCDRGISQCTLLNLATQYRLLTCTLGQQGTKDTQIPGTYILTEGDRQGTQRAQRDRFSGHQR